MRIFVTAVLLISLSLCGAALTAKAPSRDSQWKKVRESMEKGLPKSAIAELQPIAEAAIQDKAYDEAIKALAMIATLESNIQGNKPPEKIVRFQEALKDAPDEMKPMMEAILGHWYWHFFQRMRWSFMQRTQIDQPGGDDIMTWSLPRILAEIDTHYTRALAAKEQLRKIPVADYSQLLAEGTLPDTYRPTLYDFVANEALAFYRAGEQAGAKSQDEFVLQADSPIFGSIDDFVAWKVETTDTDSPVIKAIGIYQELLGFHTNDDDPGALADADLGRLHYGYNQAFGEEKNARYKAALKKFAQKWADHQLSAHAKYLHAQVLHTEGDLVAARKIALEGTTAFPESVGGKLCFNLIQQIEAKSLGITCERTWTNPWPEIQVQYRNITKVHFRAVPYEWRKLVQQPNFRPNSIQRQLNDELLELTPAKSWSADLPATDDYQQTVERLTVPRDLKPGFYFLIASQREDFGETDNQVSVNEFWVSQLALVLRRGQSAQTSGFVLDADSGDPIRQAQVVVWNSDRRQRKYTALRTLRTDENGYFSIQAEQGKRYLFEARHEGAQLVTASESVAGRTSTSRPYERTVLFTDRSLYRPGQTIQYKGICIAVDQENDNYRTLGGKSVTVVFRDVNNQEIAKQVHRTNDFGSFNGSFTAPRDRLTGRMRIVDAERRNSQTTVSVEEYKRPKFRVELAAPDKPARLNDQVQLTGTATAYTGAPIGNAKVQYRVTREVRYPIWWAWRFWWRPQIGNSQEIAHGSARTNSEGKFDIRFFARPDPSVSEEDEPQFRFTIHADVTDITGETRSDQRMVNVGFTALSATMSADSWQTSDKPVQLTIRTKSLDSEGRKANGTIKVHRLQEPDEVHRPRIQPMHYYPRSGRGGEPEADLSDPNSWPLGPAVIEEAFATDDTGAATLSLDMKAGTYRVLLDTKDAFGKAVTAVLPVQVLDANADRLGTKVPFVLRAPKSNLEPDETYLAIWGTGYESGRAYIEVEHRGKILQSYWTPARTTQSVIEQGITEAMRGGFTVRVTMVRENRAYLETQNIEVPWTNKQLQVKWEHFVSKLKPGGEESWSAIITGPQAKQTVAEMVAAMYDASLDAYLPHNWPNLQVFRRTYSRLGSQFQNFAVNLRHVRGNWDQQHKNVQITYRSYPPEIRQLLERFEFFRANRRMRGVLTDRLGVSGGGDMAPGMAMDGAAAPAMALGESVEMSAQGAAPAEGRGRGGGAGGGQPPAVDLSSVSARANLNETAFFFPHLKSDEQGKVTLEFTMPEALTEWKFLGFAHDQQLRSGVLLDTAVTSKDLMVEPLAPRFVREGDELEFTVKVTNRSAARQMGTVRLSLADARTLDPVDVQLSNSEVDRPFDVPANESRSYSWRLKVPDGMGFLIYKAVGSTGRLSDGEEGYLPVLSRRILVTESLPLPIRGPGSATFSFEKLLAAGNSDSLEHQSLTLQMVSNPAWYAVMALPYLMEYPYECTEQTFNRLYANSLARHIAAGDPKIRRIFDQWKGTEALDSPMEKNQDLKAVLLEETPWVRQAKSESEARRNVGILFDSNRLNEETARLLRRLGELQLEDGAWPWFPGGRENDYITLYITTGFGRLRHLGVDLDVSMAVKSLQRLDRWIDKLYRSIDREKRDEFHLTSRIALYLYGRSFFLDDMPITKESKEAVDYFLAQARQNWLRLPNRQSQAHLAIALKRFGDKSVPGDIMRSIKERSVTDDELGMFWRETELSWWWYRAPIETQAMMIEAFDEVMGDAEAVELCRVWLLKQKQTQDWKTTKATADAVYGLLLRGRDLLVSDELVRVTLGQLEIEPQKVEAGTGFYEQRFLRTEVKPEMGRVQVTKSDQGVAWGSLHWQYLEDMSKVTPYEGTPLTLKKGLFTKVNTKDGPELRKVAGSLDVGDELVVRIELRVDRDMEYVHMKDQRGSGLEPVDVLSSYRYQGGLAYYQSTRDTASHFFIDYLPKGTYVFEYSTRVVHRGQYQSGITSIQCMYAPEFNSHSNSVMIQVD